MAATPALAKTPGLVYVIGRSLYVSLTNRCNSVSLPSTRGKGFAMSTPLPPLVVEPSAVEIAAAVDGAWRERKDGYEAIVFAGLGEPTLRLDVLIEAAQKLRERAPLRVNTNGLGNAQHGRDISGDLVAGGIRGVTVALNSAFPPQYQEIMLPECGTPGLGLGHASEFVRTCIRAGIEVECTAVERPDVDVEAVQMLATALGASFRSRTYHPGPDATPSL
mmetsp:Transcript_23774/g.56780  ORF Transcript_23774/g.56780 Transcript_23774/m.56780 type:complete len:220 (-) Transcript_23774:76-735(-)